MINVGKIIKRRYFVRHEYGGEYLKDYLGMTNDYRIIPAGYECQRCGIFQVEPEAELKYEWIPGTTNRFAASVFAAYPSIQKIAAGHFTPTTTYLFLIENQWYTFGDLIKQEVIDRLHLTNAQTPKKRESEKGYIYLIRASTGHYKIGRTKDITARFSFFVVKLPFEIELIHHFETPDMRTAEAALHEQYKAKRVNGEWFNLTDEDVAQIRAIENM